MIQIPSYIINDVPNFGSIEIMNRIKSYLRLCENNIRPQVEGQNPPASQHVVPAFILRDFAGVYEGKDNKIKLLDFHKKKLKFTGRNASPEKFGKEKDIYTLHEALRLSDSSIDLYRLERFFAVIENSASSLIKFRQSQKLFKYPTNPYRYDTPLETELSKVLGKYPSSKDARIALSVFFGLQYLRSPFIERVYKAGNFDGSDFEELLGKYSVSSFGEFIEYLLPAAAFCFYNRTWKWIYSEHNGVITNHPMSTTTDKPYDYLFSEDILHFMFGRNSSIVFLQMDSFNLYHDTVNYSKDVSLNARFIEKTVDSLLMMNNKDLISIGFHPDSNLRYILRDGSDETPRSKELRKYIDDLGTAIEREGESKMPIEIFRIFQRIPKIIL